MSYTISVQNGANIAKRNHNIREAKTIAKENELFPHVDMDLPHEIWIDEPEREAFKRLFGEAIRQYNIDKYKYRQIPDYYNHVKNDKKLGVGHEVIIQVGNSTNHPDEKTCKEIYREFLDNWKERNPNLEVIGAYYHADEITGPHLHIDYVPVGIGYKIGPAIQASMNKALENMGFTNKHHKDNSLIQWQNRERDYFEDLCKKHGLEIDRPNRGEKHLSVQHYRLLKNIERENGELTKLYLEKEALMEDYNELEDKIKNKRNEFKRSSKEYEELMDNYNKLYSIYENIEENTSVSKEELEKANEELLRVQSYSKDIEESIRQEEASLGAIQEEIEKKGKKLKKIKRDIEDKYEKLDLEALDDIPRIELGEEPEEYHRRIKEYIKDVHVNNLHEENLLKKQITDLKERITEKDEALTALLAGRTLDETKKQLKTIRYFLDAVKNLPKNDENQEFLKRFDEVVNEERGRQKNREKRNQKKEKITR